MVLQQRMQLRQVQRLMMTPELRQSIYLLQLPHIELKQEMQRALTENPVLEEVEGFAAEESDPEKDAPSIESPEPPGEVLTEESLWDSEGPEDWRRLSQEEVWAKKNKTSSGEAKDLPALPESLPEKPISLFEFVCEQLRMMPLTQLEEELAVFLAGQLNDDGYLCENLEDLLENEATLRRRVLKAKDFSAPSASAKAPCEAKQRIEAAMQHAVTLLHKCDPPGVGARNARECLLVQLQQHKEDNPLTRSIIERSLPLLARQNLNALAQRHRASREAVQEACRHILALEPRPGRAFVRGVAQTVIPDAYVLPVRGNGHADQVNNFRIVVNEEGLPKLRINTYYQGLTLKRAEGEASLTHQYLEEKLRAAHWLIRSMRQRHETIRKVALSILRYQYRFMERGSSFLCPLVLRDVAQDIEMHESTVSRITANKYIQTPQGIFLMKHFFSGGVGQTSGEAIAAGRIKHFLRQIVASEDVSVPLTDVQIAGRLSGQHHICVARRTVAKYREALRILPSNRRKRTL